MRWLYSLLMVLLKPFVRRKLARRAGAEPNYATAVEERFGDYTQIAAQKKGAWVWIHAVSLGEARAAEPLIKRLRERIPGLQLLLTHGTATGRSEGERYLQDDDIQVWLPWDTPGAVARFLRHFRPQVGILIETEVWPNLVHACRGAGVPLVLANARLSEQSLQRARQLAWLARPAYQALAAVWAQTDADASRLSVLGAPVKGVFGNLKFDASLRTELLERGRQWRVESADLGEPPVILFASSREGEELLWLQACSQTPAAAAVRWLIVPRHPHRFDEVCGLLTDRGLPVSRRSTWSEGGPPCSLNAGTVCLGDSLGEMALYYGLADVALLGGSFAPLGGQNLIEAAACGCPVVMGPHTFNFSEAAALAIEAGAALRVATMVEAIEAAVALAQDRHRQALFAECARNFSNAHRGAVDRTASAVISLLSEQGVDLFQVVHSERATGLT